MGSKGTWFAVATSDGAAVASAVGLDDFQPCDRFAGETAAFASLQADDEAYSVFVTPPATGWTFVMGVYLPYPVDRDPDNAHHGVGARWRRLFEALVARFEEVQFFGTNGTVGFDAWARARKGRVERVFSIADNKVLANRGPQTDEERALGFLDLGVRDAEGAEALMYEQSALYDARYAALVAKGMTGRDARTELERGGRAPWPNEEWTFDLARAWGADPSELIAEDATPALGLLGRLPLL